MAEHGIGVSLSSDEDYSSDQQTPYTGGSGGGGGSSSRRRTTPPYLEAGDAPPPSKKPRGRPPGSKNKPKPPVVITQDNDKSMKPVVMTIGAGNDVMDTLISFARRCNAGITVLSGSGSVSKVTLCNPFSHASPPFTLHGPFTLLALNGTFLNPPIPHSLAAAVASSSSSSSSPNPASSFGISFSGAQGQIFGGVVGGKIVSGNNGVVLVTSLIKNPEVHRVTGVDEDDGDEGDNPNNQGGAAAGGSAAAVGSDSLFNPLMNSQVPSDANVLQWGQTAPRHPNY